MCMLFTSGLSCLLGQLLSLIQSQYTRTSGNHVGGSPGYIALFCWHTQSVANHGYLFSCVFVHLCARLCVCVCVMCVLHTHVYTCRGQRRMSGVLLYHSVLLP